ncbi:MAG: metallophosphoesterase family protein [Candidatus Helarchaeota archaeon]
MSSLKILAFSDFHAMFQQIKYLKNVAKLLLETKPNVLIFCGDFVVNSTMKQIEFLLRNLHFPNILHVWGNSDEFNLDDQLKNSVNLHLNLVEINGFYFVGLGGDEIDCKMHINKLKEKIKDVDNLVLVTHVPAKGACDLCNDGRKVGVDELRNIIIGEHPKLHLFGHIHEEARCISKIGNTTCINVGSSGALIELKNEEIKVNFF